MDKYLVIILFVLTCVESKIIGLERIVYENAVKIPLVVNSTKDLTCCKNKILASSGTIIAFDASDCKRAITCTSDTNFKQEMVNNPCSKGFPMEHGCVYTTLNSSNIEKNPMCSFYKCIHTPVGLFCPDKHYPDEKIICSDSNKKTIIGNNLISLSSTGGPGSICYEYKSIPICPVESKIKFKSLSLKENKLFLEIESTEKADCHVIIGSKRHLITCSGLCIESIKIDDIKGNVLKKRVSIKCKDFFREFWLFKEQNSEIIPVEIHSIGKWTSLNRLWLSLFFISLIIGYPFFRIVIGFTYLAYNLVNSVLKYSYWSFSSVRKMFSNNDLKCCSFCNVALENIFDASLHDEICPSNLCPYCRSSATSSSSIAHIISCPSKYKSIASHKAMIDSFFDNEIKEAKASMKTKMWRNELSRKQIPTFIWVAFTSFFFIMLFSSSNANLIQPCNRVLGEVADCSPNLETDLKTTSNKHDIWSEIELSMIDKLLKEHVGDDFQRNSINRLKNEVKLFEKASSEDVLTIQKTSCGNGKCKGSTTLEWVGEIRSDNIKKFVAKPGELHGVSVHVIMSGVELKAEMELMYYTTEWEMEQEDRFDCMEDDCSKVCYYKGKCPSRIFSKASDSSWGHNPYWCLSINKGCTCSVVKIVPKENKPIYGIYKIGKLTASAVICVEENSAYIDCDIINGMTNMNFEKMRINVVNWEVNANLPEFVAVGYEKGSSSTLKSVFRVKPCETGSCNLGSLGDLQMSNTVTSCDEAEPMFSGNMMDIRGDVSYKFAKTPSWDINAPNSYFKNNHFDALSESEFLSTSYYNVTEGLLNVYGATFGKFSMTIKVEDLELYQIKEDFEVTSFKVKKCTGYWASEIGSICTFEICINSDHGTVKFLSNNDMIIQDDYQSLLNGCNIVRKHMYIPSLKINYEYCIEANKKIHCDTSSGNFTRPKVGMQIVHGHTFKHNSVEIHNECDGIAYFGCLIEKMKDFGMISFKYAFYIMISGLIVFIILQLISLIRKNSHRNNYEIDMDKSDIMRKIQNLKSRGFVHEKTDKLI